MLALIGQKKTQSQRFLENGRRIPVTLIDVKGNCVIAVRTNDKNHYQAVQLGFSIKKNANRAEVGHAKGAKLEMAPKFLKEVRIVSDETLPEVGSILNPSDVFAPGDIVDVAGISKGKGFAGVVKRHGFHGGPKTHGQSDRHRAPGAIGQGTTPGRVYRGKKMAGRMGTDNVTVRNLEIVDVTADGVLVIKGLVPGIINGPIMIKKVGEDKKFVPLWKPADAEAMAGKEDEEVAGEGASGQTPPSGDAPTSAKASADKQPEQVEVASSEGSTTTEKSDDQGSEEIKEEVSSTGKIEEEPSSGEENKEEVVENAR